jgi:hypothetical protein
VLLGLTKNWIPKRNLKRHCCFRFIPFSTAEEHLQIIRLGVSVSNKWRKKDRLIA